MIGGYGVLVDLTGIGIFARYALGFFALEFGTIFMYSKDEWN